jgi:hypothetical protein
LFVIDKLRNLLHVVKQIIDVAPFASLDSKAMAGLLAQLHKVMKVVFGQLKHIILGVFLHHLQWKSKWL